MSTHAGTGSMSLTFSSDAIHSAARRITIQLGITAIQSVRKPSRRLSAAIEVATRTSDPTGANALFDAYQQQIYRRTDRLFAYLMVGQWIAGIVFALVVSPRTWAGTESSTHAHVWAAVFLGGAISLFPAMLALLNPGAAGSAPPRWCS